MQVGGRVAGVGCLWVEVGVSDVPELCSFLPVFALGWFSALASWGWHFDKPPSQLQGSLQPRAYLLPVWGWPSICSKSRRASGQEGVNGRGSCYLILTPLCAGRVQMHTSACGCPSLHSCILLAPTQPFCWWMRQAHQARRPG